MKANRFRMLESDILFVYGTLKRNCSRGTLISHAARAKNILYKIKNATTKGELYHLGSLEDGFPAMVNGNKTIYGEALIFNKGNLYKIIPILDYIEGYTGNPYSLNNYYLRTTITISINKTDYQAITYLFAHPSRLKEPYAFVMPSGVW